MKMFGTNGIREVVGEGLTARFVTDIVGACAAVHGARGLAIVGTDARTSSPALGRVAAGALSMAGMDVVELGILPTPGIQYNVPLLGARFAIIVTASHNPPEFNGIKGIASDGLEFTKETETRVEAAYAAGEFPRVPYNRIGTISPDPNGAKRYIDGVISHINLEAVCKKPLHVILDCGNGTSAATSTLLLQRAGAKYISLNATFDGTFPAHNSEPTEANLQGLVKTVRALGADFGVAHDGDADRAVFVDDKGTYISGEKILTLLARESIKAHGGGTVVTPVTSSDALAEVIAPFGGKVKYTRVGSPVVTRAMKEVGGVFGGEENGGVIFAEHQMARDGAMTLARVMELIATTGKSLSALLSELPPYHLVKEKVRCPVDLRAKVLEEVPSMLDTGKDMDVNTLDGVKVRLPNGWVLVRPSGTEPIYRIFAESKDKKVAEELAKTTAKKVEALVTELEAHPK
jgi:phosphomannomutase/phosphoglucomutase